MPSVRRAPFGLAVLVALQVALGPGGVSAAPAADPAAAKTPAVETAPKPPTAPSRSELAGLPAIAGNHAFGVLFGAMGSYTRFTEGYAPFRFRLQITAVASLRRSAGGLTSPLQNVDFRLDLPGLSSGKVRVFALVRYQRISNVGYWGIGNAAGSAIPEDYAGPDDRYFTWQKQLALAHVYVRRKLSGPLDLVTGLGVRGLMPTIYADTKLARDLAGEGAERALLRGYTDQLLSDGLVGLLFDSRDSEFNPSRGDLHELSARVGVGPSRDGPLHFGSLYLHARKFFPLWGEALVLALRGAADVGFGSVPLVELGTMGGYTQLGGPAGVEANRVLPYGRQLGRVKLLASAELRSTFYRFKTRRQAFALGAALFTDGSRVWADLRQGRRLDAGGPALRMSYGGGLRFVWGEALVMRFDAGVAPGSDVDGHAHVGMTFGIGQAF